MFPVYQDNRLLLNAKGRRDEQKKRQKQQRKQLLPLNSYFVATNNSKNSSSNKHNNKINSFKNKRPYEMMGNSVVTVSLQSRLLPPMKRARITYNRTGNYIKLKSVTFSNINDIFYLPPRQPDELNQTWLSRLDYENIRYDVSLTIQAIIKRYQAMKTQQPSGGGHDDDKNESSDKKLTTLEKDDTTGRRTADDGCCCARGLEKQISAMLRGKRLNSRSIIRQVLGFQNVEDCDDSTQIMGVAYSILARDHHLEALRIAAMDRMSI